MNRHVPTLALACLVACGAAVPARADLSDKLGGLTGENAKGYLKPLPKALSSTLNSAIFQGAAIPKAGLTFTVGVHVMGVSFKDEDRTFIPVDPPGFTSTQPTPVPTVTGGTQSVGVPGQGGTMYNFPGGLDPKAFVIAAPELTVGSVFGTRAAVRWISADLGKSDYGKLELFGIGAQHQISQYFPKLPVDVAVSGFYQTFKLDHGLLDTKAFHADVMASRSFGVPMLRLTPYAGIGFDTFKMDVSYDATTGEHIGVKMDNENSAHFTLGAQASLALVKLHLEFDTGANTGAAMGLSFGL
jgi:uncharacterized protein DUF6588